MGRSPTIDRVRMRRIPFHREPALRTHGAVVRRTGRRRKGRIAAAATAALLLWWSVFGTGRTDPARSAPLWQEVPPPILAGTPAVHAPAIAPSPGLATRPATGSPAESGPSDAVEAPGLALPVTNSVLADPAPLDSPPGTSAAGDPGAAPGLRTGTESSQGPLILGNAPASVHPVAPRYPPHAEARGLEATVVALVTTDTSGKVVDVRIERSGGRDFDESVRRAALSTRYAVPSRNGRPQAVAFRMPYEFRLD